jgi:hypothetical protein
MSFAHISSARSAAEKEALLALAYAALGDSTVMTPPRAKTILDMMRRQEGHGLDTESKQA